MSQTRSAMAGHHAGWARAWRAWITLLLACALWPDTAGAQANARSFDHLQTGYALTGTHAKARCESCHVNGVFKGTPKDCDSCHLAGARLAKGNMVKPNEHFPTAQACDSCHSTRAFAGARMNHSGVARGSCVSCHNGLKVQSKPADHMKTSASCDSCHSTSGWRPAQGFDHAGVSAGSCASCHNGARATGRSASHTPYTQVGAIASTTCDSCHKAGFASWTPAKLHSSVSVSSQCATCHAGIKPSTAIHAGQTVCETCHKSTSNWSAGKVDHSSYTSATNCAGCHNGNAATGKSTSHIPVGATNCASCHSTAGWKPSSFNHSQVTVTSQCATCHTGAFPPAGSKSSNHTPYQLVSAIASTACDSCHRAGFASWTPAKLHSSVSVSSQCATCHASAKPATTVHVGQTVCETCHKSTTTWTGAKVDHSSFTVATNCSSCHNGTGATGKPTTHIPVGATNCISCHTTTAWRPSRFNHSQVTVTARCATCHNGAFPPADGKPAGHVPFQLVTGLSAANCDTCHRGSFTTWGNGRVHANASITGQCKTCHGGAYVSQGAMAKPTAHIPEAQLLNGSAMECNACHISTTSWTVRMNHNASMGGGAGWCKACHATGTGYAGGMERKSLTHERKTPVATDCSESGCHRPLGREGSAYTEWD